MNETDYSHLGRETIQALLDGRLPPGKRAAAEGHLASCARCEARAGEWESLFARLEALPVFEPSEGFARRVMAEVRIRTPLTARVRGWLGLGARSSGPGEHLAPERVLDYLDGSLSPRADGRVASHVAACGRCRHALSEWRTVFRELDTLGGLEPSRGFADRVMARVEMPERAPRTSPAPVVDRALDRLAALGDRALDRAGRLAPTTRKGWAMAAGAAAAPVAAMSAAAMALFSHPQLTPAGLVAFLWWQVTGAAASMAQAAGDAVMGSTLVFQLWSAVQGLAESPGVLGLAALAFSATTAVAVWILYRNLITTPPVDHRYANATT